MRLRVLALAAATLTIGCGSQGASSTPAVRTPAATAAPAGGKPAPASAAAARRGVKLRRIGTFAQPVYLTAPPGDRRRIFVVEQGGKIRVMVDGRTRARPFLDITPQVQSGGERGLLSMAFAPDYARSGLFYVYFTDGTGAIRIVEYRRRTAEVADPGSARQVVFQSHPVYNHNGGLLLFGPDRHLYFGFGDGGGSGDQHGAHGNAQNRGTLLGKILRIDPRPSGGRAYTVPSSNPFVHRAGARPEIWTYGLRNPWRFAFDPASKALIVADVGQNEVEEITVVPRAGENLGWRVYEGRRRYTPGESAPGAVMPTIERFHSDGNCSITGGLVVRDRGLPALRGRYIWGDYCTGRVESARVSGTALVGVRNTKLHVESLSSFGEDARGRAYALSLAGPVYRLVPRG
jgi:glucose/arabinose dehydrogenase